MKKSIFVLILMVLLVPVGPLAAKEPNDPYYVTQRHNFEQIGLPVAWNYTTGSDEVVVAIIDTGADIEHPDLADNIWTNPGEIAGNNKDDDDNGYVDDVHGWNFVGNNGDVRTSIFGVASEQEDISHGTVISGIIGAVGNNNEGVAGINWQVKIMPIRAISNDGSGFYSDIGEAVHYATDMGASVISMSVVGEEFSQALKDDFRYAYDHGVVVIAAAGNNRSDGEGDLTKLARYPICLDQGDSENWLLGVSSVNAFDELSYFANYGLCVDILAPGERIYSTDHYAPQYGFPEKITGPWQGTSFAAPYLAGAAALVKAMRPDWGARAIMQLLLNTAKDIDHDNPGLVGQLGYGRVDLASALQKAYVDRLNEEGVKSIYFFSGSKLYEYFPEYLKKVYLFEFSEPIIAMDYADLYNNGSYELVLLTRSGAGYQIWVVNKDGRVYQNFKLPGAVAFDSMNVDGLSDEIIVHGVSGSQDKFFRYNIFGRLYGEFNLSGLVDGWTIRNNNTVVAAKRYSGTLYVREYNWDGERKSEWLLKSASKLVDISAGTTWAGGLEQVVVLVERLGGAEQYIIDLESGSYVKENIGGIGVDWHLILKDENKDGLMDIFRFNLNGGDFRVTDSRGDLIKTINLPKINGIIGG